MIFKSVGFFIFFGLCVLIFFLLPVRRRGRFLLLASVVLYLWIGLFDFALVLIVAAGNYFVANALGKQGGNRRLLLFSAVGANLLILTLLKYFNNLASSGGLRILSAKLGFHSSTPLRLAFPLGMSFTILTLIGYLIDVYRRKTQPEPNIAYYSTFVFFFPKIAQGPVERAGHFIPQLAQTADFDYGRVRDGIQRVVWGLFKKVVVADRLGIFVNRVFDQPRDYTGIVLILGIVFFAFQIYADFSGYTDMALGASQIFGIRLLPNFRRPYLAKSIREFWASWHMSFSQWLRDYVYLPLAYRLSSLMKKAAYFRIQTEKWIYAVSIMVTFLVCGLWHGVGWNYILWGGLFGIYLVFGSWTRKSRRRMVSFMHLDKFPRALGVVKIGLTFGFVCFAWIFFRARSVADGFYIAGHLFRGFSKVLAIHNLEDLLIFFRFTKNPQLVELLISILLVAFMTVIQIVQIKYPLRRCLKTQPVWLRWIVYQLLVLAIIFLGAFKQTQFIYINF